MGVPTEGRTALLKLAWLMAALLAGGGCGPRVRCEGDGSCPNGWLCSDRGICQEDPRAHACAPACGETTECVAAQCVARYQALTLSVLPANLRSRDQFEFRAHLVVGAGRRSRDPRTLRLSATDADGGAVLLDGAMDALGSGQYRASWTPPHPGFFDVQASFDQAPLQSAPALVEVDRTPPEAELRLLPPPPRLPGGVDPLLPGAWRRDEVLRFEVELRTSDFAPETLSAALFRANGQREVSLPLSLRPCDAGSCASGEASLWLLPPDFFRETYSLRAEVADGFGNLTQMSSAVPITRWKWAFDAGGPILTSPAVGGAGRIAFGTASLDGGLLLVTHDGRLWWSFMAGRMAGSPTFTRFAGTADGEQLFACLGSSTELRLGAFQPSDGGHLHLLRETGSNLSCESSFGALDGYAVVAGRFGLGALLLGVPAVPSALLQSNNATAGAYPGATALGLGYLFNADPAAQRVRRWRQVGASLDNDLSWAVGVGSSSPVLTDAGVFVGTVDRSVVSLLADGGVQAFIPGGLLNHTSANGIAGTTTALFAGGYRPFSDGPVLERVDPVLAERGFLRTPAEIVATPVVGEGGRLYLADLEGTVVARTEAGQVTWSVGGLGPLRGSPNLDCARMEDGGMLAGRPGVLYVPSEDGRLYAFIVDSRGIDVGAPWPKYQRDPRNTGNSQNSLEEFRCP